MCLLDGGVTCLQSRVEKRKDVRKYVEKDESRWYNWGGIEDGTMSFTARSFSEKRTVQSGKRHQHLRHAPPIRHGCKQLHGSLSAAAAALP